MNIEDYQNKINQKKGQQQKLQQQLKEKKTQLSIKVNRLEKIKQAQEIIQAVAKLTQDQIKIHISDIVNLALQSIPFEEQYEFGMDFVVKRNKTECELYFIKNGYKIGHPIDNSGGGVLDVASFGLRTALWSLKLNKKNNTIIIDEPFKNINDPENKLQLKYYIGQMVKKVSEKLGIQFIIIGSNNDFIEIADKVIKVKLKNGISEVV